MSRKVAFAQLHQQFNQPGVPPLSTMGRTLNSKLYPGIEMYYTDSDLEVSIRGIKFAVAKANVVGVVFEKETPLTVTPITKK